MNTDTEAARIRSIKTLRLDETPASPNLRGICEMARELFGVRLAAVTILDTDEQVLCAQSGEFPTCTPRGDSFCTHAIRGDVPMVVEDATLDPRFRHNPHVVNSGVRFYAGVPISVESGLRVGAFIIVDTAPRSLTPEQLRRLQALASMAETDLRLHASALHLRASERRFKALVRASASIVWRMSTDGQVIDISLHQTFADADPADFLGLAFLERIHPDDVEREADNMRNSLRDGTPSESLTRVLCPAGEYRWMEVRFAPVLDVDGRITEWVGSCTDCHDRKLAEQAAWRAANHDVLTGLSNRKHFQSRVDAALLQARSGGTDASLLLVDLDNFKDVNDSLGHQAGDQVLMHVASVLVSTAGQGCTVARLGGDEFAIVVPGADGPGDAAELAERILRAIELPIAHDGLSILCHASIGISAFPRDGDDSAELLRAADMALYEAKGLGRNRACRYAPRLLRALEARTRVAFDIRDALRSGRIVPHYQPKVDLDTGRVSGFEALVRWDHPTRGILPPGEFLSAMEDHELSLMIGERMMETVLSDIAGWIRAGVEPGRVAVNLSTAQFALPDLASRLISALDRHGVPARYLELEVTETVFLSRSDAEVARTLAQLHDAGISIALDDFGTGFASLTHLKQFPVDRIKIDRSFVSDIERDPDDAAIVSAIAGLGSNLGIVVVAEGVETEGQLAFVRSRGCQEAQGYLYSPAIPAADVSPYLAGKLGHRRAA